MLIRNAAAFIGGRFREGTELRLMHGKVQEIGAGLDKGLYEAEVDLAGDYLLPGFVDVHIHAFQGHDAMAGEQAVRQMARRLYREGVAAFLPTTMSAPETETAAALAGIRAVMEQPDARSARVLGAHMEAPYLNPDRCGAQRKEFLHAPDPAEFLRLCADQTDTVRLLTLAPEWPGAEAFVRWATARGVTVSIGHTAATAAQTHQAADWGASHVTHTFNAQTALHHREPGVPGAALTDERLYAEFIGDGIHLHPDVIKLLLNAKGAARVVAVTDAMEAAGMSDGEYALGGQQVFVKAGEARLVDGTLAGSVLTMPEALRNMIHRFGIAPEQAVMMATQTPAESIGERVIGHMTVGSPAPLTRWSRDWQRMTVIDEHSGD